MKKLSIAIVLVAASVTFAKAQTTETTKVKQEMTTAPVEVKADTVIKADTAAKADVTTMDTMKAEQVEVKKESAAEMKQKAREEKKAAKKLVE